MTRCDDEGLLRAYLDDELPPDERRTLAAHLAGCAACRSRLAELRTLSAQVGSLLRSTPVAPDPHHALARLWSAAQPSNTVAQHSTTGQVGAQAVPGLDLPTASSATEHHTVRRIPMPTLNRLWSGPRRTLFAGLAAVVVVLSLLALPPVRAAADQLLQVFRVQNIVFVPVSQERVEQLRNLNVDGDALFISKPKVVNNAAAPRMVDSLDEAVSSVGFTAAQPAVFPSEPLTKEFRVSDHSVVEFQVNVETTRQLLTAVGVDDVSIPDSLGTQPISADIPPTVSSIYHGPDYDLILHQGHSPSVTLPEGVDLAQLGKAGLRLLGMTPEQAEAMSQQIDWSSTLVIPIPTDISAVQQVKINGAQGMLVSGGTDREEPGAGNAGGSQHARPGLMLYWQQGERFYILEGRGIGETDLIKIAESVR